MKTPECLTRSIEGKENSAGIVDDERGPAAAASSSPIAPHGTLQARRR